jgi:Flp pilus assembly protein TadB
VTDHGDLRVGDAERTRVTDALHDHFAQGRLTRDELDERLDATLSAKTYGDLLQITRDLPGPAPVAHPGPPTAGPATSAGPPAGGRRPRGLPLLPLAIGVFVATMLLSGGTMWALFGVLKVIFLVWLVMALVGFVHVRRRRRRGRRSWPQGQWHGPYGGRWQRGGPGGR